MNTQKIITRPALFIQIGILMIQVSTSAAVDYGDVQPPPTGKVDKAVEEQNGVTFRWMTTRQDVPVYTDSACAKQRSTKLTFRKELFELWRTNGVVLLADSADGGKQISVVGYAKQKDFIESRKNTYRGLRADNKIQLKAMVVHRWDKGAAVTAEAVLRDRPDESAPKVDTANLFEFLYVYALSSTREDTNGFCLVGNRPNCEVGNDGRRAEVFRGWLENRRVFFWDHRQALEYNKSQDALKWRRESQKPVQFFADEKDLQKGSPVVIENLAGAPWSYYMARYPIMSTQPLMIDNKEYLKVGVIGDSFDTTGNTSLGDAVLESEIRQKLEKMRVFAGKMDVLFVIDATGSMAAYYQSIKESVGRIRQDLEASQEKPPMRYATLYYRDYVEEANRDSWSHHFVDFTGSTTFAQEFPHKASFGGQDNPPPFYALDTAVKKAGWDEGSMRVVILIGDMGNEQPDTRGFTAQGVIKTLREHRCEFFAIQATPQLVGTPKIDLFNAQALEIALGVGMPKEQAGILSADGKDVGKAVMTSVQTGSRRADQLRKVLQRLLDGEPMNDAIIDVLKGYGINPKSSPSETRSASTAGSNPGSEHGSIIQQHLLKLLGEQGIDAKHFAQKRIQHFGFALAPTMQPGAPSTNAGKSFTERILMSRTEFQLLTAVMGTVVRRGLTPATASDVWRQSVNQLSGDFDEEMTFDENVPLSEYMTKALGIPVRSKLLQNSVVQIRRLKPEDLADMRDSLEKLVVKQNNYDNEMSPDGVVTEKHWFLMRGEQYSWLPLELMP